MKNKIEQYSKTIKDQDFKNKNLNENNEVHEENGSPRIKGKVE